MIIPAFNESANIEKTVNTVINYGEKCDFLLDYVVINDGSTDNTLSICREKGINCINLVQNLGIGGAVQTGYIYADIKGYDIAVQFDGDGQHDIESLKHIVTPVAEGKADFVVGSRFVEGTSSFKSTLLRRIGIKWLSFVIKVCTGERVYDVTSGYRAANRKAISLLAKDYPVDYPEPESIVFLIKNGIRVSEAQVNMFEREGGMSSIHSWKSIYYMIKVTFAILCAGMQRRVKA